MTTIERPHGAGTLVIRPSGPHHQGALYKPQYMKPSTVGTTTSFSASHSAATTTTTTSTEDSNALWTSNAVLQDLQPAAATSSSEYFLLKNVYIKDILYRKFLLCTVFNVGIFSKLELHKIGTKEPFKPIRNYAKRT